MLPTALGKPIRMSDNAPSLHELYCEEEMFSSSDEDDTPLPVPPPKPRDYVMWSNDERRWIESFGGKWRVAFHGFLDWWHDNIENVNKLYSKLHPDVKPSFIEHWTEIREFWDLSCETDLQIRDAISRKDFTFDIGLDMKLNSAIDKTAGDYPLTIWSKIDHFAQWCNARAFFITGQQQP